MSLQAGGVEHEVRVVGAVLTEVAALPSLHRLFSPVRGL